MLARHPMLWFAAAFAAGILLARCLPGVMPFWSCFLVLGLLVLLTCARRAAPGVRAASSPLAPRPGWIARAGTGRVLFALGLMVVGLGAWRQGRVRLEQDAARRRLPRACLARVRVLDPPEEGLATDAPGAWRHASGEVLSLDGVDVPPIPVRLAGWGRLDIGRGDLLVGRIRRQWLDPPAFEHDFDYARYLETRGLVAAVSFTRAAQAETLSYTVIRSRGVQPRRWLDRLRARAVRSILTVLPGTEGEFLAACTFGYRLGLDRDLREAFQRVGIGHVLAISGLHVGLVAALFWWSLSFLIVDRRHLAAICIPLCLVYLALSGMRIPAVRATVMIVIYLSGFVLMRRSEFINSLGVAALLLLGILPATLIDLGFQLSFVAVLFISRLGADLDRWLGGQATPAPAASTHDTGLRRQAGAWGWRYLRGLVVLSLAAWLGVTPLVAMAFQRVNPIGLLANLVALPLMTFVLAGGIVLQALALLPVQLNGVLASVAGGPATMILRFADHVQGMPFGSIPVCPPPGWVVAMYYAGFVLFFLRRMVTRAPWSRRFMAVSLCLILVAGGMLAWTMGPASPPAGTVITLLPGRESETVVVETPAGEVAVLGRVSRAGRDVAQFLRGRRRDQAQAVLAMSSRREPPLQALRAALRVGVASACPLQAPIDTTQYPPRDWQALAGIQGVEVFVSRDRDGRLVWWAVRAGGVSVAVGEWCWSGQLAYRLRRHLPGAEAALASIRTKDARGEVELLPALKTQWLFLGRSHAGERLPAGVYARRDHGAVQLEVDVSGEARVRAFDGNVWAELTPY